MSIVQISSVPHCMTVILLRSILSEYGEIERIFLKPNKPNPKKNFIVYDNGWIEFKTSEGAENAVKCLNGFEIPNSRKKPWEGSIMSLKLMDGYTWKDVQDEVNNSTGKTNTTQRKAKNAVKARKAKSNLKVNLRKMKKGKGMDQLMEVVDKDLLNKKSSEKEIKPFKACEKKSLLANPDELMKFF